jgi:anti-sigma factor RsiW
VVDLAAQGFTLTGGRLDYLDHRAVAALVYRHREHPVTLFVLPSKRDETDSAPARHTLHGYEVLNWTRDGMSFWAVSDTDRESLEAFAAALRARG